ncbi:MAG: DNA-binding XRE family transcriptional regulator [Planctomycetota bacterium]|jgi:DNA-binding XRE family transcriptional regulator
MLSPFHSVTEPKFGVYAANAMASMFWDRGVNTTFHKHTSLQNACHCFATVLAALTLVTHWAAPEGQLLRTVREEKGLTQVGLADTLGKPQSFISKIESGERRLDLVELREVCRALGITLTTFVERFEAGSQ